MIWSQVAKWKECVVRLLHMYLHKGGPPSPRPEQNPTNVLRAPGHPSAQGNGSACGTAGDGRRETKKRGLGVCYPATAPRRQLSLLMRAGGPMEGKKGKGGGKIKITKQKKKL